MVRVTILVSGVLLSYELKLRRGIAILLTALL